MLALAALTLSVLLAVAAHVGARNFTSRRLRFTRVGEHPGISGLLAGVGVVVVALPLMTVLPLLSAGSAMLLGAGVGTGIVRGTRPAFA